MNKIDIHSLMMEWEAIFNNQMSVSDNQLTPINEGGMLDIKISHTEKIFGLCGRGTHVLRKMKDIAMSQNKTFDMFLPLNRATKSYSKPLWNVRHGYMYYRNQDNTRALNRLIATINHMNNKYRDFELLDKFVDAHEKRKDGIIGIDIAFDEPQWLKDILTGSNMFNPIIDKNGRVVFSKGATSHRTIDSSIRYLHKKTSRFNSLYPEYISITKRSSDPLNGFIGSDCSVAIVGYDKHARVIYKDGASLCIIDSWKQTADAGTRRLMGIYKNLQFVQRKAEQGHEGSCVVISLARSLYASDVGTQTITVEIPYEYLVLANRLVSKFRKAR